MRPDRTVGWIHPSIRDLVVDQLEQDPHERQAFLRHASSTGLVLALSSGGGAEGTRTRPLLKTPDDWEALTSRTLELIAEGGQRDLVEGLLPTLAFIGGSDAQLHRHPSLRTLVQLATKRLHDRWVQEQTVLSLRDIRAYYRATMWLEPLPAPPPLAGLWEASWVAFQALSSGQPSAEALREGRAWLLLVEFLHDNEPRWLRRQDMDHYHGEVVAVVTGLNHWLHDLDELDPEEEDDGHPIEPDSAEFEEAEILREFGRFLETAEGTLPIVGDTPILSKQYASRLSERAERSDRWEEFLAGQEEESDYGDASSLSEDRGDPSVAALFSDLV